MTILSSNLYRIMPTAKGPNPNRRFPTSLGHCECDLEGQDVCHPVLIDNISNKEILGLDCLQAFSMATDFPDGTVTWAPEQLATYC